MVPRSVIVGAWALIALISSVVHSQSPSGPFFIYEWREDATGCAGNTTALWDIYTNGSCEPQQSPFKTDANGALILGVMRYCTSDGVPMEVNCTDSRCSSGSCLNPPNPAAACVERRGRTSCRANMVTHAEVGARTFTTSFYEFEPNVTEQRCKTNWYNKYIRVADSECHLDSAGSSFKLTCGRSGQVIRYDYSDLECKNQKGEEAHTFYPHCFNRVNDSSFQWCGDFEVNTAPGLNAAAATLPAALAVAALAIIAYIM